MNIQLSSLTSQADWDFFFKLGYHTHEEPRMDKKDFLSYKKELKSFIESQSCKDIFIAKDPDSKAVGYLWVAQRGGMEPWNLEKKPAWIYDIVVKNEYRGQGIGTLLLDTAENWAKEHNFHKIGLHTDNTKKIALNLYKKQNYKCKNCYVEIKLPIKQLSQYNHDLTQKSQEVTIIEKMSQDDQECVLELAYLNFQKMVLKGITTLPSNIEEKFTTYFNLKTFTSPKIKFIVLKAYDNSFIGYTRFYQSGTDTKKYTWILNLEIAEQYQRQHYGMLLLKLVEAWTVKIELDTIKMEVHYSNHSAKNFVKKLGFRETNYFMEKDLKTE